MIEAEIKCVSPSLQVPDLGLSLIRGQVIHLSEADARGSVDLTRLVRAGGVTVRYRERVRERRERGQGATQAPTPARRFVQPLAPVVVPVQVVREVPAQVDEDRIVRRVAAEVMARMDTMQGDLTKVLSEALAGVSLQATPMRAADSRTAPLPEEDDHPMFIPEVIGGKESKAAISVESGKGGGSVDEATAALKAMKRTPASRKEKKES